MENAAIPAHARIGTGHQVCPVYGRLLDGSGVGVSDGIGVVLGVTVGAALGVGVGVSLGVGVGVSLGVGVGVGGTITLFRITHRFPFFIFSFSYVTRYESDTSFSTTLH